MTVVAALTLLLSCQLAGELVTRALTLPVPGPVFGLALLFLILLWRRRSAPALDQAADLLLANLSLLFVPRSEEHTSELQSLMRISYAVFCLQKKKKNKL